MSDNGTEIDKGHLYGMFQAGQDWKSKLNRKAAHKALDIPDDDVNITKNNSGIGALGAVGIAACAGLPPLLVLAAAAAVLLQNARPPEASTPQAPPPATAMTAADTQYEFDARVRLR